MPALRDNDVIVINYNILASDLVYVILEICKYNSMMELHLRRGALTEPEVRYYMKQLCLGIEYLHAQQIIHRDLKVSQILKSIVYLET